MQRNYHIFVACGYILILAGFIWFMAMPTNWRIGLLIVSGVWVATSMYLSRENEPLSRNSKEDWNDSDV